jgi:hypothetical protein
MSELYSAFIDIADQRRELLYLVTVKASKLLVLILAVCSHKVGMAVMLRVGQRNRTEWNLALQEEANAEDS